MQTKMAEIIKHPRHPDYCKECIFHEPSQCQCKSEDYKKNIYYVNCAWRYCKYKKVRKDHEI